MVRDIFCQSDSNIILNIYLSKKEILDKLIWRESVTGSFSVKSACYVARKVLGKEVCSVNQRNGIWRAIWTADVLPKVKVFAWRMFHGILPICTQLVRKGLQVEDICSVCGSHGETMQHIFFDCSFSTEVWKICCPDFRQDGETIWGDIERCNQVLQWLQDKNMVEL